MTGATDNARLDRIAAALESIVGERVKYGDREEWESPMLPGGLPTRLDRPFRPLLGAEQSPGFEFAVASGMGFANPAGHHVVRRDEQDPPEARINTDSYEVFEDLTARPEWPEVLRIAGLESSDDLLALVRRHVFLRRKQRDSHHSPTVPEDVAGARPKDDAP